MTAGALVRCDFCSSERPAAQTFEPYRGAARCRDTTACERRQIRAFDPTVPREEDLPRPPTSAAPHGTTCAVCGAARPPTSLYDRGHGQWFCRDRAACDWTAATDMAAVREDFADFAISSAEMRGMQAAAPPVVPESRSAASHAESAEHAQADLMYSLAAAGRRDR